ncbi:nucleotidyltransferase family protein [Ignatzschineria larvae DSM 13226]|uniref:Nucleotidyltransferase family protein n=1 Tax=Ignatzschineria larvae DSM 13226 TaxID=1111732 RepID=A0ABZ3C4J6_9GAMM|nr:nucleotidyltransferase family protein [Ignatzschineria larvae]
MIALLLMAAGSSERFKASSPHPPRHKLTMTYRNSRTLLEESYQHAHQVIASENILIVTNQLEPNIAEIAHTLPSPHISIQSKGLGESIAKGLAFALKHNPHYEAVLILPADLPFIQANSFKQVIAALTQYPKHNIRPYYQDIAGHPVAFQRCYFSELLQLSGDQGAQKIVQKQPLKKIYLEDPGIIQDIDTYEDFCQYHPI